MSEVKISLVEEVKNWRGVCDEEEFVESLMGPYHINIPDLNSIIEDVRCLERETQYENNETLWKLRKNLRSIIKEKLKIRNNSAFRKINDMLIYFYREFDKQPGLSVEGENEKEFTYKFTKTTFNEAKNIITEVETAIKKDEDTVRKLKQQIIDDYIRKGKIFVYETRSFDSSGFCRLKYKNGRDKPYIVSTLNPRLINHAILYYNPYVMMVPIESLRITKEEAAEIKSTKIFKADDESMSYYFNII